MSELAFIDWLRKRTPEDHRVLIGPGDDAALIRWQESENLLLSTDMLLEGSCFTLADIAPQMVGRKAMAVNLSDMAAMAAHPVAAVVSIGIPRTGGINLAEEIFAGLQAIAREFETAIVGGDTNSWNGPLVINVTIIGRPTGRGAVRRNGARPGDWLIVTGPLGGSIHGKHLNFTPRVREAAKLHALAELKAMIDISDGLALDLSRLCRESRCGAILHESAIPISEAAKQSNDRQSPLEHALFDGEDFELLFAASAETGKELLHSQPVRDMGVEIIRVGECIDSGLWLKRTNGKIVPLEQKGYEHTF